MKRKTKCLVDIVCALPQATFEYGCLVAIFGGVAVGTVGAGITALVYDWKTGANIAGGGLATAGIAAYTMGMYGFLVGFHDYETGTYKLKEAVKKYKETKLADKEDPDDNLQNDKNYSNRTRSFKIYKAKEIQENG